MLQRLRSGPKRVLMTVDAVGGVWRYAMDLARQLKATGTEFLFLGLGPEPGPAQRDEAEALGELVWLDALPDWLADDPSAFESLPRTIEVLACDVDLIHLNAPTHAAGLRTALPVVVVAHSCVPTWFAAVRNDDCPQNWSWQKDLNRAGLDVADAVIAPSHSHARAMEDIYGLLPQLSVIYNGSSGARLTPSEKRDGVLAAGRWWDVGKNAAALDAAASRVDRRIAAAGACKGPNGAQWTFANVRHLGSLSTSEMAEWLAGTAIVVSPSIYEPFGLVPLEGARAGAALVLADIHTYRELWDGTALFVDPHNSDALAAAINRLSADASLRTDLAAKAQARSEVYSLEAQANAVGALYRSLVQQTVH